MKSLFSFSYEVENKVMYCMAEASTICETPVRTPMRGANVHRYTSTFANINVIVFFLSEAYIYINVR